MEVSISSIMPRSKRCRFCKSEVKFTYIAFTNAVFKISNKMRNAKHYSIRMPQETLNELNPSHFSNLSFVNDAFAYCNSINIDYYKIIKTKYKNQNVNQRFKIGLTCECGRSTWFIPKDKRDNKANIFYKHLKLL